MKFLIVSDSHGDDKAVLDLYKAYPKMDYYLHAGDSQSHPSALLPFDVIRGNCDYIDFDDRRLIHTPQGDLLMKHYPNISIEESRKFKFFIHGHTHRYEIKDNNGLIVICPGSISFPRDDSIGSYAILEVTDSKINITIYELETKNILASYKI